MSISSTHVLEKERPSCNSPRALVFRQDHVFAVELNASRAARIAEAYPDVRLLGPCSFEATRITRHSFSLVYLNPPFDDEFGGGGREETSFLRQAVDLLVPGGILVLVCPVNQVLREESDVRAARHLVRPARALPLPRSLPDVQRVRRVRPSSQDGADGRADLPGRHPDEPRHPSMFGRADRQARSPRRTAVPPMALR